MLDNMCRSVAIAVSQSVTAAADIYGTMLGVCHRRPREDLDKYRLRSLVPTNKPLLLRVNLCLLYTINLYLSM